MYYFSLCQTYHLLYKPASGFLSELHLPVAFHWTVPFQSWVNGCLSSTSLVMLVWHRCGVIYHTEAMAHVKYKVAPHS